MQRRHPASRLECSGCLRAHARSRFCRPSGSAFQFPCHSPCHKGHSEGQSGRVQVLYYQLAAPQGFEPRYADPESAVLPLNEGAASAAFASSHAERGRAPHRFPTQSQPVHHKGIPGLGQTRAHQASLPAQAFPGRMPIAPGPRADPPLQALSAPSLPIFIRSY